MSATAAINAITGATSARKDIIPAPAVSVVATTEFPKPPVVAVDAARVPANPELMAAAEFDGHPAPPAIFPRAVWSQLALLRGDQGARAVLESAAQRSAVAMPSAALDADTPEELARLGRTLG